MNEEERRSDAAAFFFVEKLFKIGLTKPAISGIISLALRLKRLMKRHNMGV